MKWVLIVLVSLTLSMQAQEEKAGVANLSQGVRDLFSEEMRYLEREMQNIFSYIVRGEYEKITKSATKIQESFILKKRLTDQQRVELKEKLPRSFIEEDRAFHTTAGKLAEVAEFDERKEIERYYIELTGKCVACHATYATHVFSHFTE